MSDNFIATSKYWCKETGVIILDPDGWDRLNYEYSFNEEKITLSEFEKRKRVSTVLIIDSE